VTTQESLARDAETTRTLHPTAVKLAEVLTVALQATEPGMQRDRIEHALRSVEDVYSPNHPRTYNDLTAQQARTVLESLKLLSPDAETYRLVIGGEVVSTFLARNRHHAINHARKHHGIECAEYRWVGGRHEVHAVEPRS